MARRPMSWTMSLAVVLCMLVFSISIVEAVEEPSDQTAIEASTPTACELDRDFADVTGDGVEDKVVLVGWKQDPSGHFSTRTAITVTDGATDESWHIEAGLVTSGYGGRLFLGDFSADGVADIMAALPTGGSGGMVLYSIFSCANGNPKTLFDQDALSVGPRCSVTFRAGFTAAVFNRELRRSFDLDLSKSKQRYIEAGVYDSEGALLEDTHGVVNPYELLQPRDIDGDGTYELVGFQRVWGLYHADTLGVARSVWRWSEGEWELAELQVMKPEDLLAGMYWTVMVSALSPGMLVTLTLDEGGEARMSHDYVNGQPAVVQIGTWTANDNRTVSVHFTDIDGRSINDTMRFRLEGDLLVAIEYDADVYGWEGLTLERHSQAKPQLVTVRPDAVGQEKTLRGYVVLGPEVKVFTPCDSNERIWVTDESGELWDLYQDFAVEPYEPIFVELDACEAEPPTHGVGRSYKQHLVVTRVVRAAHEGWDCRENLAGIEFKARGVEPFWNVTIDENGITFFELTRMQVKFSAAPAAVAPGRWIYYSTSTVPKGHWILIVIDEKRCVDPMSGEVYGFVAEVLIDGQRYQGCAARGLALPK